MTFNQIKEELEKRKKTNMAFLNISHSDDILLSAKDADALIIITEWEDYRKINWEKIAKSMRKPSWVFDTRGIVDFEEVKASGINIWQVGNGYSNN